MRTIDELRHALADETAELTIDVPTRSIRRRARRIRTRRAALVAAGLVLALAVPAGVLAVKPNHTDVARPGPTCATPSSDNETIPWIGEPVVLDLEDQYNRTGRHDVLVGLYGAFDTPSLLVVFRYEATGVQEFVHETRLRRTPDGGFALRDSADPARRLMNVRMNFGALDVVDVGLYAGWANAVEFHTEGATTRATVVHNEPSGWTLFWARHDPWSPLAADAAQIDVSAYATNGEHLTSTPGTPGAGVRVEGATNPPIGGTPPPGCR
jgi:hypothetical protein